MEAVSDLVGFALPILLLPMVLAFWERHDALGIDTRKDRKNTRKRLRPRVSVNWPVSINTVMGTVRGRVIDVGVQGAGLLCLQPLSPTGVIRMTLEIPGHPVAVEAEVVWCDTRHRARREAPYHDIGVLFRSISNEDRAFLTAFVEASISEIASENIQEQGVFTFRPKARNPNVAGLGRPNGASALRLCVIHSFSPRRGGGNRQCIPGARGSLVEVGSLLDGTDSPAYDFCNIRVNKVPLRRNMLTG